jgi:hypothetical protein
MWADNETTVDVLGFDYLVDTPEVVLQGFGSRRPSTAARGTRTRTRTR